MPQPEPEVPDDTALVEITDMEPRRKPWKLVAAAILVPAVIVVVLQTGLFEQFAPEDPVNAFLVPPRAAALADPEEVRNWPEWSAGKGRNELALAEQVWMDPAGVNAAITDPLEAPLGMDGVIRVTWNLILIGQLHRLALVMHRGPYSSR